MKSVHVVLAVLIAAIWGVNFVVIKIGLNNFPPLLFSCLRFFLSAIPAVFFIKRPKVSFKYIFSIGVILGIVKFSLLFEGIKFGMSAGLSSILLQSQVFFSVIAAFFIFHERVAKIRQLGIVCGIFGMLLIATQSDASAGFCGFLLTIGAGIAWSCSNILMRKIGKANMISFMVWMSLVPIIPMFLFSWGVEGMPLIIHSLQSITLTGVFTLFYVSFLSTVLGYGIWGHLLTKYPIGQVAPFSLLVPVFGILSSHIILGEQFNMIKVIAMVLILMGLIINSFGARFLVRRITK